MSKNGRRLQAGGALHPIEWAKLEAVLAARAEPLRRYLTRRIPPRLRPCISPEDIMQETWATVFREFARTQLVGEDAVERWVTTIATRRLVDAIRRLRRLKRAGQGPMADEPANRTSSLLVLLDHLAAEKRTPSREVASKETEQAVRLALAGLPKDRCQAVWMRHIEGCSREEIAEAMNKTLAAVNGLLYQGLRQLRMRLGRASRFFSDPGRESFPRSNLVEVRAKPR